MDKLRSCGETGGHANLAKGYTANGQNQYTAIGGASPSYDANGNLTSDGTSSYGYDVENRLIAGPGGGELRYDPLGRLWQGSSTALGTTRFLWYGDRLVAEYDGSGAMTHRYVHGDGTDRPLVQYDGAGTGNPRYLYADERGSVVAIADVYGNLSVLDRYDEYGVPASTNQGRFQYTGQLWLPEVGLYYYKARVYSPGLGRFLQTDPIGYASGTSNGYGYVGGDPINATDPAGLAKGSLPQPCPAADSTCAGDPGVTVTGRRRDPMDRLFEIPWAYTELQAVPNRPVNLVLSPINLGQAPQKTQPSTAQCIGRALWNNKAVLALDGLSVVASFVPGGRGLLTVGASIVGSYTGVAALGIGVAGKDATGAIIGGSGHYVSVAAGLMDGSKGLAKNLPVAGQALAIGGAAYDVYNTIADSGCVGGKK